MFLNLHKQETIPLSHPNINWGCLHFKYCMILCTYMKTIRKGGTNDTPKQPGFTWTAFRGMLEATVSNLNSVYINKGCIVLHLIDKWRPVTMSREQHSLHVEQGATKGQIVILTLLPTSCDLSATVRFTHWKPKRTYSEKMRQELKRGCFFFTTSLLW